MRILLSIVGVIALAFGVFILARPSWEISAIHEIEAIISILVFVTSFGFVGVINALGRLLPQQAKGKPLTEAQADTALKP